MKRAARSLLDTFPWRPLTSPGTPCDSWKTREAEWEKTRPQRRKATLDRLREVFKEGERGLTGWDQILDWLHDHGFRNREGRPVNERTVRGWMKRLGCPILRGCRAFPGRTRSSAPFTSNYLLLAWAISLYRSGGMDKPRFEGRGVPKLPRGKSRYSSPNTGASSAAPASPTCARPTRRTPETAPHAFSPFRRPEHGEPLRLRRTVMGPRGDDHGDPAS